MLWCSSISISSIITRWHFYDDRNQREKISIFLCWEVFFALHCIFSKGGCSLVTSINFLKTILLQTFKFSDRSLKISFNDRRHLQMTPKVQFTYHVTLLWGKGSKNSFFALHDKWTTPKVPLLFLFTLLHYYTNIHSLTFIYKDKENLESAFAMLAQGRD